MFSLPLTEQPVLRKLFRHLPKWDKTCFGIATLVIKFQSKDGKPKKKVAKTGFETYNMQFPD